MTIAASHGPAAAGPDPENRPIVPAQAMWRDDDTPWEEEAACRGTDPELFFPIGTTGPSVAQTERAKAICARCPVQQPCLAYALSTGQQFGIWGGYDETERRRLRRSVLPRAAGHDPAATRHDPPVHHDPAARHDTPARRGTPRETSRPA